MKRSELKKLLRNTTAEVTITPYNRNGYRSEFGHAVIRLSVKPDLDLSPEYYCISAQCDLEDSKREMVKTRWHIEGIRRFYGLHFDTSVCFDLGYREAGRAAFVTALFDYAREIVEAKNLHYVYPDCAFSRFIVALETMGIGMPPITVDGKDLPTYNREARERAAS